jgi:hypothetical protein
MAVVTFNVPCKIPRKRKDNVKVETKTGRVAYFDIAGQRIKFVLQHGHDAKPDCLVHYASGFVFGRFNEVKLGEMLRYGHNHRIDDRRAAELLIARAVAAKGADFVLNVIAQAPVINA